MKRLSIRTVVFAIFLIPITAYVSVVAEILLDLSSTNRARTKTIENLGLLVNTSKLINSVQTERGKTILNMSGKITLEELNALRQKVDVARGAVLSTLTFVDITSDHTKELTAVENRLVEIRKLVSTENTDLNHIVEEYTSLIKMLIGTISNFSNYSKKLAGVPARINSLAMLEDAREAAGILRPLVSKALVLEKPVHGQDLSKIVKTFSAI